MFKSMKRKILFSLLLALFCVSGLSAQAVIDHLEPPNWWVGMKNPVVQLMVHGKGIAATNADIVYPGVRMLRSTPSGENYLFLDLEIAPGTRAGKFDIKFMLGKKVYATFPYELKERKPNSALRGSFGTADNIYLIMPDRFVNGDPANDDMPGMLEKANRKDDNGRHGGDLRGVRNSLSYLQSLGITAIWSTPFLENNQPKFSYHGYACTDLYKVDPRFGTTSDYCDFVDEAHKKGIKVLMDLVFNHFGSGHWWMKDLPAGDWVHQWPEFTRSNYRGGVITDPYRSDYDHKKMEEGWFDTSMPDFNQDNPFVATYLIQNSIWWIEYAGLDGIRQDTYPYPDKEFMVEWMKQIRAEYPNFNVVGEAWLNNTSQLSYWLEDAPNKDKFNSRLSSIFDFPLCFALQQAFNEEDGWDKGTARLYEILSMDFLFSDPQKIVSFLDNHDIDRISSLLKTPENLKMALAFLATTRGTPLFYYGTEIMMPGLKSGGDGKIRQDFPGGWKGDSVNVFERKNLDPAQTAVLDYFSKLMNWRKTSQAAQNGKLTHYIPENSMYVYFRTHEKSNVMVVLNNKSSMQKLQTARYAENMNGYSRAKDVISGEVFTDLKSVDMPAKSARILELLP
jgi:glycosidase